MKKTTILVLACCAALAGCDDDAEHAWSQVLKKCAVSDLDAKNTLLYFGPSNNVGPGTVWRVDDNGSYNLRWTLETHPEFEQFVAVGSSFDCAGTSATKFKADAKVGVASEITPVSGSIGADFARAKEIEVKASSLHWDQVVEGPYEEHVRTLPSNDPIKQDLLRPGRYVLKKALRVSGYEASLSFDRSVGAELKAKYSGQIGGVGSGTLEPELSLSWSGDTNLTITSNEDFYVAGRLGGYTSTGFSAATTDDSVKDVTDKSSLVYDPVE